MSEHTEGRTYKRGRAGLAKLEDAVAGIIGGVLANYLRDPPRCSFQSNKRDAFSGGPIGFRQWKTTTDGLQGAALIGYKAGVRFTNFGVSGGEPARYWPTEELLAIAAAHGVTGDKRHWTHRFPTTPPAIKDALRLSYLKERTPSQGSEGPPQTPNGNTLKGPQIAPNDPVANALRGQIEAYNAEAVKHTYAGCTPPQWSRSYKVQLGQEPQWNLGGRWTAGGPGNYQSLSSEERQCILIDGQPVVEVDASASHLSIFLAQMGVPCDGDPYAVPDIPRESVKAWVVQTLSTGRPASRWAETTPSAILEGPPIAVVHNVVLTHHPSLASPWLLPGVVAMGGANKLLVTNYLRWLEAGAMTAAMESLLSSTGCVALPVHDSLIVPFHISEAAQSALRAAYRDVAGVHCIRLKVLPPA